MCEASPSSPIPFYRSSPWSHLFAPLPFLPRRLAGGVSEVGQPPSPSVYYSWFVVYGWALGGLGFPKWLRSPVVVGIAGSAHILIAIFVVAASCGGCRASLRFLPSLPHLFFLLLRPTKSHPLPPFPPPCSSDLPLPSHFSFLFSPLFLLLLGF